MFLVFKTIHNSIIEGLHYKNKTIRTIMHMFDYDYNLVVLSCSSQFLLNVLTVTFYQSSAFKWLIIGILYVIHKPLII